MFINNRNLLSSIFSNFNIKSKVLSIFLFLIFLTNIIEEIVIYLFCGIFDFLLAHYLQGLPKDLFYYSPHISTESG